MNAEQASAAMRSWLRATVQPDGPKRLSLDLSDLTQDEAWDFVSRLKAAEEWIGEWDENRG